MAKKVLKLSITLLVLALLAGGGYFGYRYITDNYTVQTVYVDGNVHYTDDEIKDIVMTGKLGNNTLWLSRKYKDKKVDNIPFVETMDVTVISPDTIKISVYEKTLAGYIEYLGKYVYFDKDGIVAEVSEEKTAGLPEIIGVDFDYIVLYEPLPAENEDLFLAVLNMTKLMTKYNVVAQKMYFKDNDDIVLYHDDIVINLGNDENIDLKVMNLPPILEKLEGKAGTLRMEDYDDSTDKTSFEPADRENE